MNYKSNYIQTGNFGQSFNISSKKSVVKTVKFSTVYSVTPKVYIQIMSTSTDVGYGNIQHSVYDITTSQFKVRFFNNHTGNLEPGFLWLAIGKK